MAPPHARTLLQRGLINLEFVLECPHMAPSCQSSPQFIHVVNIGIGLIADVKQHSKAASNIVQTGSKELAHLLIWNGIFGQLR